MHRAAVNTLFGAISVPLQKPKIAVLSELKTVILANSEYSPLVASLPPMIAVACVENNTAKQDIKNKRLNIVKVDYLMSSV